MGKVNRVKGGKNPMSKVIQKRQSKEMKLLIDNLRKIPIVQVACEKTGVSRATFYRWHKSNSTFAKQADDAINESVEIVNDMAEAKLVSSIRDGNMTAIVYWLKHRHKAYSNRVEVLGTLSHLGCEITDEYRELINKALRLALPEEKEVSDE